MNLYRLNAIRVSTLAVTINELPYTLKTNEIYEIPPCKELKEYEINFLLLKCNEKGELSRNYGLDELLGIGGVGSANNRAFPELTKDDKGKTIVRKLGEKKLISFDIPFAK